MLLKSMLISVAGGENTEHLQQRILELEETLKDVRVSDFIVMLS